jgi:hypothetical protein
MLRILFTRDRLFVALKMSFHANVARAMKKCGNGRNWCTPFQASKNISKSASSKSHHVDSQAASVHSHSESRRSATSKSHIAAVTSRREHRKHRGTPVTWAKQDQDYRQTLFILAFAAQHEGYLYSFL